VTGSPRYWPFRFEEERLGWWQALWGVTPVFISHFWLYVRFTRVAHFASPSVLGSIPVSHHTRGGAQSRAWCIQDSGCHAGNGFARQTASNRACGTASLSLSSGHHSTSAVVCTAALVGMLARRASSHPLVKRDVSGATLIPGFFRPRRPCRSRMGSKAVYYGEEGSTAPPIPGWAFSVCGEAPPGLPGALSPEWPPQLAPARRVCKSSGAHARVPVTDASGHTRRCDG